MLEICLIRQLRNRSKKAFGDFGEVGSVNLVKDRDTGHSKGFAFIEMVRDDEADKAIFDLDGTTMGEREIKVNQVKPERHPGGMTRRERF